MTFKVLIPKSRILLAVVWMTSLLLCCPQSILAQDCGSMVRDDAHLFGGDLARVESAAEELQNSGAQVYVRTFPTTGDEPTVDRLEHSIQDYCPGWQSASGARKTNLVVIIYADRDSAGKHSLLIATGPGIDQVVSNRDIDHIRAQVIIPAIKAGNPAQGFARGLVSIKNLYEAAPTGSASSSPTQQTAPSGPVEPADSGAFWLFMKLIFWMIVVGVGVAAYQFYRGYAARRQAKAKALQVYNDVTAQINAIDSGLANLQAVYETLAGKLSAEQRQKTEEAIASGKKAYEDACADFGAKRTFDPHEGLRTVEEYDSAADSYQEILAKLKSAAELASDADHHLHDMQQEIESAPQRIQEIRTKTQSFLHQIKEVNAAGFRTEAFEELVAEAGKRAEATELALKNNQPFDVSGELSKAEELLKQAAPGAKLPDTHAGMENDLAALKNRIEQAKASVQECKTVVDRMDAIFARESFESVTGNGSQAVEHVNWCDRGVPLAEECISMAKQDWQKGAEIIAEANGHLDRADSLTRSISSMEKSLNIAKEEAPTDIQSAEQDLAKAQEYLQANNKDVRKVVFNNVTLAIEAIASAKAELQKQKPDYFEAVKSAKRGHAVADDILNEARSEHEAAERLREKAATALRDATSRVNKAKEYIEDNARYVEEKDKDLVKKAQTLLDQAQSANTQNDLENTVQLSEQADEAGKTAYNNAQNSVEEQTSPSAYDRANHYYAPSHTTIFVNENDSSYSTVGAGSGSGFFSSLFSGSGSSSSSSWSGSDSSSSWSSSSSESSSSGGSDSSSSW